MDRDEGVEYAISHTQVVRAPRQKLATFGVTSIVYYLVTEPAYADAGPSSRDTVVRDGRVIAEKPKLVTPSYLTRLEGFSDNARHYIDKLAREQPHAQGLLYSYRNQPDKLSIVSGPPEAVIHKLNEEMEQRDDPLTAIIRGVDELWDVSLLKFISELTEQSLTSNLEELHHRGLLGVDSSGVTAHARHSIEELFNQVRRDRSKAGELKMELDRWGLFSEYEDRFYDLFRR